MPTFKPFHIAYEEGAGMRQVLGEKIANLDALEIYGSGLEPKGDLRGGPLVTSVSGIEGVTLCWIRGVPHARQNVWEAWGIVAPSAMSIKTWPSHWDELKMEPSAETITSLGELLQQGWGNSWPVNSRHIHILSLIHRRYLDDKRLNRFTFPVHGGGDVGALAGLWLLGPIPWDQASVGPPRKIAAAVPTSSPLTYEGLIGGDWPEGRNSASPFLESLLSMMEHGDVELAVRKIESFRQMEPELQRKCIEGAGATPVTGKRSAQVALIPMPAASKEAEVPKSMFERLTPPKPQLPLRNRLRMLEYKVNTILVLLTIISLTYVIDCLVRTINLSSHQESSASSTAPAASSPLPAPERGRPKKETSPQVVTFNRELLEKMHVLMIRRLGLEAAPSLKLLNQSAVGEQSLRQHLAGAAVQILLSESGCGGPKIDGDRGSTTNTLISRCNNEDLQRISQSEEEALKWIRSWLLLDGEK